MQVLVLGAGYAGFTLARKLERRLPKTVDLTLVTDSPDHLIQHELHRVIRRPERAAAVTVSLPSVLDRTRVYVTTVNAIDRERREVHTTAGTIGYGVAAICLGARTADHGIEGVVEHAFPLKRLEDALAIRRAVFAAADAGRADVVVGGAGLSGVQAVGELAALASEESIPGSVTLIEQEGTVAPTFSADFQQAVSNALEAADVRVRTGATVTSADVSTVHLASGENVPYDVFVWTGGIRGTDALDGERPVVEADLRLDDRTFVLGDAARVLAPDGTTIPASAQSAVREAETAAVNVSRLVASLDDEVAAPDTKEGDEAGDGAMAQVDFDPLGWTVSVGDDAVAQVGPTVVTGRSARMVKHAVGLAYRASVCRPRSRLRA